MKPTLIIIIALFALITGCKKTDVNPSQVSGQVLEYGNNKPIPYAYVHLLKFVSGDILGGGGYNTIKTIQTDSIGSYTFDLDPHQIYYIEAQALKDYYIPDDATLVNNERINLTLIPSSTFAAHIVNAHPFNNEDKFAITGFTYVLPTLIGRQVDTTVYTGVYGNTMHSFYYYVEKNGIEVQYRDSIYCPAHKTTVFEIRY